MNTVDGMDVVECACACQWEAWLARHHGDTSGVWVKIARKHSGTVSVTIADALDVALCYGWIDSTRRTCDGDHYLQRYSPRRRGSSWSRINIGKAEALIDAGRMRDPGFAAIRAAKTAGRWGDRPKRTLAAGERPTP